MGCGANIKTNKNISETTKKAERVYLHAPSEETDKIMFDKDIEKEGYLESNRRGKPIQIREKKKKHWIFEMEDISATEAFIVKPWCGLLKVPEYYTPFNKNLENLVLDVSFVYGYQCAESRNNLFYTQDPQIIVFPAGIFGIVYNYVSNSQMVYKKHEDEIVSLCLHKASHTVATGDKRYLICIWNCLDLITYKVHKTAVKGTLCLSFCPNSDLLAVLGADFKLIVYKWVDFSTVFELEIKETVFFLALHPERMQICVVGKKFVGFVDPDGNLEEGDFGNNGKVCNMTCAVWFGNYCLTGATNGQIYQWIPSALQHAFQVFELGVTIHAIKVKNDKILCSGADRTLMVLGAEMEFLSKVSLEGYAKSIDFCEESVVLGLNNGTIVKVDGEAEEIFVGFSEDVLGVLVISSSVMLVTMPKEIKIFDYLQRKQLSKISFKTLFDAFTTLHEYIEISVKVLDYSPILQHIAISVSAGYLTIFKHTQLTKPLKSLKITDSPIESLKYSPDGYYLAGSFTDSIIILETSLYTKTAKISYSHKVKSIDWSLDSTRFQTSAENFDLKFWSVQSEELESMNQPLNTWSSRVGWPFKELQADFIDLRHVICVKASKDFRYLAVGDDWGMVSVFEVLGNSGKKIKCQASHIQGVEWSWKNEFLFSGGNRCVVQSRVYTRQQ